MELLGGYKQLVDQTRARLLLSCVFAPVIALSFLTLAFFALKLSTSSRVVVFTFGALSVMALIGYRSPLRSYKRHRKSSGAYAKNVLLVGAPSSVQKVTEHLGRHLSRSEYESIGWMTSSPNDNPARVNLRCLGDVTELGRAFVNHPIHEVIAVQSSGNDHWIREVIENCEYYRVRLHIVPDALLEGDPRRLPITFRSEPLLLPAIVLSPPNLESDALFFKRLIDIVGSAVLLVLLAPLFLVIAIGIKLTTPHLNVIHPWRVIGLKGRSFTGYKFTTMVADAEQRQAALLSRNEMKGPVFKVANDPRVTRLGKILRKYSLNELPQLWSVLKGDMSLVGPRPAFRHELERYELWHKRKLCVKPGITCLWQVSGRNKISNFDDWVRLDLQYIDEWSLWLDFRILARTVVAVVTGTGQ